MKVRIAPLDVVFVLAVVALCIGIVAGKTQIILAGALVALVLLGLATYRVLTRNKRSVARAEAVRAERASKSDKDKSEQDVAKNPTS